MFEIKTTYLKLMDSQLLNLINKINKQIKTLKGLGVNPSWRIGRTSTTHVRSIRWAPLDLNLLSS